MVYEIGWFSSGRDEAARELLEVVYEAIQNGFIDCEIAFVFSNRKRGQSAESDAFFGLVDGYDIDLVSLSSKHFNPEMRRQGKASSEVMAEWRRAYDREVMKRLEGYAPDLCVLAGYMLITGDELCERYTMINLHPALPGGPTGTWQDVIWKLLDTKADKTGVMMHLVTPELDRGPPITYCSFPIRNGRFDSLWKAFEDKGKDESLEGIISREGEEEPLFKAIRNEGVRREPPLIIQTIKEFADGKLSVADGTIMAQGEALSGAYDLTEKIEKLSGSQG